jgi:hypothetical protein
LNAAHAAYVVIGGMAVIQAGFPRATGDIDLLIDPAPDNQRRVREALMGLAVVIPPIARHAGTVVRDPFGTQGTGTE